MRVLGAGIILGLAALGVAAADGPPSDGLPVIAGGREQEVVALLRPYGVGSEVAPGWVLWGVSIEADRIRCVLAGPGQQTRTLILTHPGRAPAGSARSRSFALLREAPPGAAPAPDPLDVLAAAVEQNDASDFWPPDAPDETTRDAGSGSAPAPRFDWRRMALGLPGDGIVIMLVGLVFLLAHLSRQMRDDPPWVAPALLALLVVGAILRAALPSSNLMEAWAYERLAPLPARIWDGEILRWLNRVGGGRLFLTDVLFASNYLIAIMTPLAMYAHARYILGDHRQALAAAGLLVILPEHLRFSRSDVYMIQSIATSSMTFVVLYTALGDRSRAWRVASFAMLPLLCTATYFVRPENIVFFALDLGAIYICTRGRGIPGRAALAVAMVSATALLAAWFNLRARYSGSVEQGLALQTLFNALRIAVNPRLNTLVNPWIMPPLVSVLAILGARSLSRRGERPRAIFLVAWLVGFFLVHSFVYPYHAAMQARYHMNLVSPLVLLAAAATPVVLAWRPLFRWAVAAYLAAVPLLHRDFIGDARFNEMREFDFLRSLRTQIPAGCTVLEYRGAPGDLQHQFASRLRRVAAVLEGGQAGDYWTVVDADVAGDGDGPAREQLSPAAAALLAQPPHCLVFYEGLSCASLRRPGETSTPVCAAIRERLELTPFASATFASRIYDPVNSGYLGPDADGGMRSHIVLGEGTPVALTAYRARAPLSGR